MKASIQPRPTRRRQRGNTVVGLFFGLVLGVAVSAVVVWLSQSIPNPFNRNTDKPETLTATSPGRTGAPQTLVALPGKPGDVQPPPPTVLQGEAANKPAGDEPPPSLPPPTAEVKPAAPTAGEIEKRLSSPQANERYFLQAGAYKNSDDANNQKAKIALMGIEVKVVPVAMGADEKMYRIRVGPFSNAEEADRIRDDLNNAGINSVLVSTKE